MRTIKLERRYPCPVCGYALEYPPDDFNICPSCGVEFGYETAGRSVAQLRREWVTTGARWASRVDPRPKNWNPWLQLIEAGFEYAVPFRVEVVEWQSNIAYGGVSLTSQMAVQIT
jgi:hypothetical protein